MMVEVKDLLQSLREQQWRRERSEHWCSVTIGTKEDEVYGSGDRCGQVERVFLYPYLPTAR